MTKFSHKIALPLALALGPWSYGSVPEVVKDSVPVVEQVGATRFSFLLWDVYDISLYAPSGKFDPQTTFALHLEYLRFIRGDMIAEKSVDEMRKQGVNEVKLAAWYVQMKNIFPDVDRGTELIGVFNPQGPTEFYNGSEMIGQVVDPEFGPAFAGIWLGQESSRPELRKKLIGLRS